MCYTQQSYTTSLCPGQQTRQEPSQVPAAACLQSPGLLWTQSPATEPVLTPATALKEYY